MKKLLLVVVILLVGGSALGVNRVLNNPDDFATSTENDNLIFDATKFYTSESSTVSELELVEMLGEADSIEEWNHDRYPIRTLSYDGYNYHFNSDMLQRISIDKEIPYEDKDDILKMFGLQKYRNSSVKDTNVAYRVTNCGVHDFWTQYSEESISSIRISYGSLFN